MNAQTVPFVDNQIIIPTTSSSGSFVYNMQGIDRASLQLNATLSATNTAVVTLSISNDGINYSGFSTAKTITFTNGTVNTGMFELGAIDYVFLKVSSAAPSAGTFALQGVLYGTGGSQVW
jgi:hypothetical protein